MSEWQDEKAERNRQSLGRLTKALPHTFPSFVISHALGRPFVPPTPRLAIDSSIDALTRFAPIVWRAPLLHLLERPAAGLGASAIITKAGCRPISERRPRRIANGHTP